MQQQWPTVQNLTTLASAIPEIWLQPPRPKFSTFSEILPLFQYRWLPVTLRNPSPLTIKFKSQSACTFQFMCKKMEDLHQASDGGGEAQLGRLAWLTVATSICAAHASLNLADLPFTTYNRLLRNQCVTKFEVSSCSSLSHSRDILGKVKF